MRLVGFRASEEVTVNLLAGIAVVAGAAAIVAVPPLRRRVVPVVKEIGKAAYDLTGVAIVSTNDVVVTLVRGEASEHAAAA